MSRPSQKSGCFSVFIVLLLLVSLIVNAIFYVSLKMKTPHGEKLSDALEEKTVVESSSNHKIAVINIYGVIGYSIQGASGGSMVEEVIDQLERARRDDEVKAVIIRVDSPGGEVNASDVLYSEIKKTRGLKPVVIQMMSMATSGGYYAAMGGSRVVASELTITGSIGVIMQSLDYEALAQKVGLRFHTFKSGKFKDILNPDRLPTEEEKQYIQEMIMESYDKFVGIVAIERQLDITRLREGVADGRPVSGKVALAEGLVDKLGNFETAVDEAKKLAEIKDAKVFEYTLPFNFSTLFQMFGMESKGGALKLEISPEMLTGVKPGRLYYMAPHLLSN